MTKKLSVIIPAHNAEKYIAQCTESIINQTYNNLEIIVIDDASTDSTPEIIKKYAAEDGRIKAFFNEKNLGAGATRNKGINLSSGDYITFVDADDYLGPDRYTHLMGATSIADIIFANATAIASSGSKKTLYKQSCTSIFDFFNKYIPPWTKIIKRSILQSFGIRFSEKNQFEDLLYHYSVIITAISTNYVVAERNKIHTSIDNSYYYRLDLPESLTAQSTKSGEKYFDLFRAWEDIATFINNLEQTKKLLTVPKPREILPYFTVNLRFWLRAATPAYKFYKKIKTLLRDYDLSADDFPKDIRGAYNGLRIYPVWEVIKYRLKNR